MSRDRRADLGGGRHRPRGVVLEDRPREDRGPASGPSGVSTSSISSGPLQHDDVDVGGSQGVERDAARCGVISPRPRVLTGDVVAARAAGNRGHRGRSRRCSGRGSASRRMRMLRRQPGARLPASPSSASSAESLALAGAPPTAYLTLHVIAIGGQMPGRRRSPSRCRGAGVVARSCDPSWPAPGRARRIGFDRRVAVRGTAAACSRALSWPSAAAGCRRERLSDMGFSSSSGIRTRAGSDLAGDPPGASCRARSGPCPRGPAPR